jgi:hypothetical protein
VSTCFLDLALQAFRYNIGDIPYDLSTKYNAHLLQAYGPVQHDHCRSLLHDMYMPVTLTSPAHELSIWR